MKLNPIITLFYRVCLIEATAEETGYKEYKEENVKRHEKDEDGSELNHSLVINSNI